MPELPEVETTRRGISPYLRNRKIIDVVIRQRALRWPIPRNLKAILCGQQCQSVDRRAKYLLIQMDYGTLLIHLGMSGRLSIVEMGTPARKHDHLDFCLDDDRILRFTDPRRFGCVLWVKTGDLDVHPLLSSLGPEPLDRAFSGAYLYEASRHRKQAVKVFLMDGHQVVGVGNIYANEALFLAGIHPVRPVGELDQSECRAIAGSVKRVLTAAIKTGGTTLQDFLDPDGRAGYFSQSLQVYGRAGQPCLKCGLELEETKLAQRTTVFCSRCQR